MRKIIVSILCMLILTTFSISLFSQKSEKKEMTWTSSSEAAKTFTQTGVAHLMNAEFALAYQDLQAAEKLDPDFTIALTFLSNLTRGATQKSYAARALKSSVNKTEGEKLFATLTDEKNKQEQRIEIWSKLHTMFPDGKMIGHFYVVTRTTPDEQFAASQEYIKKFPDAPAMYNLLGYYYLNDKKDNTKAKECFEKYIAMYPDGYNPYDSMGEFYLVTGDMENSKKYYSMSVERYPFNDSAVTALQKMEDDKKKLEAKK